MKNPISNLQPPISSTRLPFPLRAIIVLAVLLRLASAFYQGDAIAALPGIHDQFSYDALARRVLAGDGFTFATQWWPLTRPGEPTAHWSYLYTLYLAAVYALFGPHPLAARLIQAVIAGVLHPWLAWRLGRRVFGVRVGLIAAALSAVYAYFVYYAGALMTETFYILAILWALDTAMGLANSEKSEIRGWFHLGLALGVAALLRQVILLFVPFLFAWLWWATRSTQYAARSTPHTSRFTLYVSRFAAAVAVIAVLILPWTVRNYRAFGRFVLLNTNAGYAFFWANHPIYGTRFVGILPPDGPSYQDLIPPELRHLDEAALDRALLREGLRFVVEDPVRYILLSVSRIPVYFKFWPSSASSALSNIARVGSFGLLLPWMIYGLILTIRNTQYATRSTKPVILLLAFITTYTAIHLLSWSLIRYRLPVDAVLILFAALAMDGLWERYRRRKGNAFTDDVGLCVTGTASWCVTRPMGQREDEGECTIG